MMICSKSLAKTALTNLARCMSSNLASNVYIPPKIEYENGFLMDQRPGKREIVEYFNHVPCKSIRFEIAVPEDRDMLGQMYTEHFNAKCSLFQCLKPDYEDTAPFCFEMLEHALEKNITLLAFDDDKLIGYCINTYHTPDEFDTMFHGQYCQDNPVFEIKDDYGKIIDNGPLPTRKGNQIGTFCGECYWQTGKFLPKDVKNFGVCEAVGTLPQYARSRFFQRSMELSEDLFRKNNCNYVAAYCAAVGSYEYCKKRGYELKFKFPYEEYRDHGKVLFKNLSDGAVALHVQLLKL